MNSGGRSRPSVPLPTDPEDAGPAERARARSAPDELLDLPAHGIGDENRAFTFAIPFDSAWAEALDLLTLTGPEGTTSVDRARGARAALLLDTVTGRARSIVRHWPGRAPARANDGTRVRILRGLPRRPG